jgi:cytosine/adenosine deaminase-related metal-dependent hydrolase
MSGAAGVAGHVNAHTHLYSALAAFGLPAPAPAPANFVEILERFWWKLDRAIDFDDLAAGARLYVAEALLAGTTTLIDHHESPSCIDGALDVLADSCDALGIRAVLCYGATERNGGRWEASAGLAECARFVRSNRRPHVRGLVGLHASFTASNDTLHEAATLCAELGVPAHVHVAEGAADVADARKRGYTGPLERMLELGALPPGSILAHGVQLDEAQVVNAERDGCWFVQNPRSNEGNQVGYPAALWASGHVALGTDGYPADMRVEFAALERLAAAHPDLERADPGMLRARLDDGVRLAATFFGPDDHPAGDRVERDGAQPGAAVRHVTVGGRRVVEDGRLVRDDLEAIRARAREAAGRLRTRMERM